MKGYLQYLMAAVANAFELYRIYRCLLPSLQFGNVTNWT